MGSDLARDTEKALGFEPGTFDHAPPEPGQPSELGDYIKAVQNMTSSGKLSVAEIRAMYQVLKARDV